MPHSFLVAIAIVAMDGSAAPIADASLASSVGPQINCLLMYSLTPTRRYLH
jgi:hypothetical protein